MELDSDLERFRDALKRFKAPSIFKEFVSPVKIGGRANHRRVSSASGPPSPRTSISSSAFSTSDKNDDEDDLNEQQQPDSTTSCAEHHDVGPSVDSSASDGTTFGQLSLSNSPLKRSAAPEDSSSSSPSRPDSDKPADGLEESPPPKRCRSMPPVFENSADTASPTSGAVDNGSGITTTSKTDPDTRIDVHDPSEKRCNSVGPSSSSSASEFKVSAFTSSERYGPSPDPRIDEYFKMVATTGKTLLEWPLIRPAFFWKLRAVLEDFYKSAPYPPIPKQNIEHIEGPKFIEKIVRLANDRFTNGIPFTIQRLCELLTAPGAQYRKADKFFRAVEKNLNIVSTVNSQGKREIVPSLDRADTESVDSIEPEESNEALALPVAGQSDLVPQANFTEILEQSGSNMDLNGDGSTQENSAEESMEMSTSVVEGSSFHSPDKSSSDEGIASSLNQCQDSPSVSAEKTGGIIHAAGSVASVEHGNSVPNSEMEQVNSGDVSMELDSSLRSSLKESAGELELSPGQMKRLSETKGKPDSEDKLPTQNEHHSPSKQKASEDKTSQGGSESNERAKEDGINCVACIEGVAASVDEKPRQMIYGHHDNRL